MANAGTGKTFRLRGILIFSGLAVLFAVSFFAYNYSGNEVVAQERKKPVDVGPLRAEATEGQNPHLVGSWGASIATPATMVHSFVLPNGKVMFFPSNPQIRHFTDAYIWDPEDPEHFTPSPYCPVASECSVDTPNPSPSNYEGNLFCAGHNFLQDGRLLISGGHFLDGNGTKAQTIFDFSKPESGAWQAQSEMNDGRWYPSNCTLGNGEQVIMAGSKFQPNLPYPQPINRDIEIFRNTASVAKLTGNFPGNMLYPFSFLTDEGKVFIAGPETNSFFINPSDGRSFYGQGSTAIREYGTAVMYEEGKIMIAGGGSEPVVQEGCDIVANCPYSSAEKIDIRNVSPLCETQGGANCPAFTSAGNMHFRRKQLNSTLLPDNRVLVTGGSEQAGHSNQNGAVLTSEMWDPYAPDTNGQGQWNLMAPMANPGLYHSTAFLLPDARVVVGGGEWILQKGQCNKVGTCQAGCPVDGGPANPPVPGGPNYAYCNVPQDNLQIYSPPYLFNADGSEANRPDIQSAPQNVGYNKTFFVKVRNAGSIVKVTWVRLSTVTHSFNQGQRINNLQFSRTGGSFNQGLEITTPVDGNHCPPGFYMLFIIDNNGTPSKAKIIQITDKEASNKFDYGVDRKTDMAFWRDNKRSPSWHILHSDSQNIQSERFGRVGDKPVPGDYDGDGQSDLALWRASTGEWVIKDSSDGLTHTNAFGMSTDIPVPADYDGDRLMDLAVWRPTTGEWIILRSSDHQIVWYFPGITQEDLPVPGYYDDDAKADIAFWRPSTGNWHIFQSSSGLSQVVNFGLPGDYVVPSDYDGDTKTDLAVWRPSNSVWYIYNSKDGTISYIGWGAKGDRPVADDYDGDGHTDIAIWRPSNGTWWIMRSADHSFQVETFGVKGDRAIPSIYFRNCLLAQFCNQLKQ